jgi:hypothetical protein
MDTQKELAPAPNPKPGELTLEARAFLDQLDELLVKGDKTAQDIASVITALRSFDDSRSHLKSVITIPIRRRALPKCAEAFDKSNLSGSHRISEIRMHFGLKDPDDSNRIDLRELQLSGWSANKTKIGAQHYGQHAADAAKLLGLRVIY